MKLHFLGTTGYHPNNVRQTACMMIPEMGVVLDAGTGMFRVRDLLQTDTLDIFLSHVHLDHCVGLTFLYDVLNRTEMQRVTVHVDADKVDTIRDHLYAEQMFPVKPNFEFNLLKPGDQVSLANEATLTTFPLEHPSGSLGFRIDWPDRSMAYVTDTTADPAADYVQQIAGVQTLIHECYFRDGQEDLAEMTGHSCLTPVAEVAAKAAVERLFMVHINPLDETESPLDLDSVRQIYAKIEVPADRDVIDL